MGGVSYSAGAVVRVVLTVPGLWWAGAMGPDTHLLLLLLPVFSTRGSKGAVVVHSFGVHWSNPWVHWSNPLVNWSNRAIR